MIDYSKIGKELCVDIIQGNKTRYERIFRYEKETVKSFCQAYLDGCYPVTFWGKLNQIKRDFVEFELVPYLVKIGALQPSMKDSINYGLIEVPRLYKRDSVEKVNGQYIFTRHQDRDLEKLSIARIGEIYFDKNGQLVEHSKKDLSKHHVENMLKFYSYAKKCSDCDQKWLAKVEKTLEEYGIFDEYGIEI